MFRLMIKLNGIKEFGEVEYSDYEDTLKDAKSLAKYSSDGFAYIYEYTSRSLFGMCIECIKEG